MSSTFVAVKDANTEKEEIWVRSVPFLRLFSVRRDTEGVELAFVP